MTTIGSSSPYYASLYNVLGKSGGDKNAFGGSANDYAAPQQSVSGGITGSETVFGAKLRRCPLVDGEPGRQGRPGRRQRLAWRGALDEIRRRVHGSRQ